MENPGRLVSNVALHHFCHTLYSKSKLTGPLYSKRKKIICEHEGQGKDMMGACLGGCLPYSLACLKLLGKVHKDVK